MKILFFDYWLKGIANFERLVPEFQKHEDIELKMIHVGSWKEPQRTIVTQHKGFVSYDISYYHTYNLYKVLKREKPDVLLMLNLTFLLDKCLVIACKYLNIEIIYLAHGRLGINEIDTAKSKLIKDDLRTNFFKKIRVDTLAILYNYCIGTVFLQMRPWLFVQTIVKMIKNPFSMTIASCYTAELKADKLLVFYQVDKESLIKGRDFPDTNIHIVGNPEFDNYINTPLLGKNTFFKKENIQRDYLLYLEDGLVENRMLSTKSWYDLIIDLKKICNKHNIDLIIKLHPRTNIEEHKAFFDSEGILYYLKIDLKNLIEYSLAITSQFSTTITLALISGKRVISPRWKEHKDFLFYYPQDVIHYSYSTDDFEDVLFSDFTTLYDEKYISQNIGIPNGKSIRKIVNEIIY